ncbi:MAG: hypothetical protein O7D86_06005 [Proteobacteria bacterium]|nr:hypothetical protein [Pseudomonadota bacterium]
MSIFIWIESAFWLSPGESLHELIRKKASNKQLKGLGPDVLIFPIIYGCNRIVIRVSFIGLSIIPYERL